MDKKSEEKSIELKPDELTLSLNQPILEEINPEYSLDRLKLKLWYFGHLILEKTLMLGKF